MIQNSGVSDEHEFLRQAHAAGQRLARLVAAREG